MISLLGNPIVKRELVGVLRTRRAAALQIALCVAMTVLVVLRWPSHAQVDLTGQQARDVLSVFAYGLMTLIVLLSPVFPATSIVRERQQGTLALLLNSPMSRLDIYLGKLVGVLGFVVVLLILSLPAAVACYAMGGVGLFDQLGLMYAVLLLSAIEYAVLGLWVSSVALRTDTALRMTYGLILLLAVVALGPFHFLHGATWLPPAGTIAIEWIRCLSPVPAIVELMGEDVGQRGVATIGSSTTRFVILASGVSLLFALLTLARLNQRIFDRARAAGKITDDQSAKVRFYRRIMYLWFFDPQRRSGLIGPLTNPVMVKEFRTRKFGRAHWIARLFGGCVLLSLALMLATTRGTLDWGPTMLGAIMVVLTGALIVLVTPSLATGIIAGERESGGWTLLQMTPLSSWSIVVGKLLSVAWIVLLILLATLPGYAVLWKIDATGDLRARMPQVMITLVLTAVMSVLVSAAVSSLCRRTTAATALAYTILVGGAAGTFLIWLGRDAPFPHAMVEKVLTINPLAAALALIDARGFTNYQLLPANWWFMGGVCVVSVLVLLVQTWRLTRPR